MGSLIQTFEPISNNAGVTFTLSVIIGSVFLIACGFLLFVKVRMSYNYRLLLAMLAFFFGLIAIGNAFFTQLTKGQLGTISIYEKGIETPGQRLMLTEIKDAYIYADNQKSIVNPEQTIKSNRILLIEYGEEKVLRLAEEDYPIEAIFNQLKEIANK